MNRIGKGFPGRWSGERPTIGLLIDNVYSTGGYQTIIWQSVIDRAADRDVNLTCFAGGTLRLSPLNEYEYQRNVVYDMVTPDNVDGIIIINTLGGNYASEKEISAFYNRYRLLPMVSIGRPLPGVPSIMVDNESGIHDAVTHLADTHKLRRIAFISGPTSSNDSQQRFDAYREGLSACGLPFDPDLVAPGDYMPETGAEAVRIFLDERRASFEAVIAANDNMAIGAMEALQARGIHVPFDIAVIGFDDIKRAQACSPALTTVAQPIYEQGVQAVDTLLQLLADEPVEPIVTFPTRMIVRQSCGCNFIGEPSNFVQTEQVITNNQSPATRLAVIGPTVISKMETAAALASEEAEKLFASFQAEFEEEKQPSGSSFIETLDYFLRKSMQRKNDVATWHIAVSILRNLAMPCFPDSLSLTRAIDLWRRAWSLIGDFDQRMALVKTIAAEEQAENLRDISQSLITAFQLEELVEVAAREIPRLGIKRCYISLYENPKPPYAWSRSILAFDENGRRESSPTGRLYPTCQLIPEELLPSEQRRALIVESLYFQKEQFGLALFEIGPCEGPIYATLRAQISSALKGAFLLRERRRAEEELAQSKAELEQFAILASHDLSQPLRIINERLRMVEKKYLGVLDNEADEFIDFAVEGADRMQRLLEDLLNYSRLNAPDKPLIATDTAAVLEAVLAEMKVNSAQKEPVVTYGPLPTVSTDAGQFAQLVRNLIDNALKFCSGNKPPRVHIGAERGNGEWVFYVRDNGIGIAPEYRQRIFLIFQRLNGRNEYPGTGIGLAVCKRIVERHGGRIWVDSNPVQGSTFYFTIPDQRPPPRPPGSCGRTR